MPEPKKKKPPKDPNAATRSQIAFLKGKGVTIPDDLTAKDAKRYCDVVNLREKGVQVSFDAAPDEMEAAWAKCPVDKEIQIESDRPNWQASLKKCQTGEKLIASQEPPQSADRFRLGLYRSTGEQIGFVSRDNDTAIVVGMNNGEPYEFYVQRLEPKLTADSREVTAMIVIARYFPHARLRKAARELGVPL